MRATGVSASVKRSINLGDYNSVSFEVAVWGELEEGETVDQATTRAMEAAKVEMIRQTRPFTKGAANVTIEEKFAGKPVKEFLAEHGIA